jgi:hypothetical protein
MLPATAARAARILSSIALPAYNSGRAGTVETWLSHFDDITQLERFPQVAAIGSRIHASRGRSAEAERWLEAAERSSGRKPRRNGGSVRPWIAVLHAAMCRDGVDQMLLRCRDGAVGARARQRLASCGAAHTGLGVTRCSATTNRPTQFSDRRSTRQGVEGRARRSVVALSERSLIAMARDDHIAAGELAHEAHEIVATEQLEDYPSSAIELAASARVLLRHGQWDDARKHLTAARRVTRRLTEAVPWLSVRTRLRARACLLTLRDTEGARALFAEARTIQDAASRARCSRPADPELQKEIDAMPELSRAR